MWKIVKAELSYLKPLVLLSWAIFALVFLARSILAYLHGRPEVGHIDPRILDSFLYTSYYIINVHLVINLLLLLGEMRENRIRLLATLPVTVPTIGLARLVTPLLLLGLFVLLCVLHDFTLPPQVFDWNYRSYGLFGVTMHGWWYAFGWWTAITFGCRLITERSGRILLVLYLVLILTADDFIYYVLHPPVATMATDLIENLMGRWGLSGFYLLLALASCIVLQISFVRRRSYVQQ